MATLYWHNKVGDSDANKRQNYTTDIGGTTAAAAGSLAADDIRFDGSGAGNNDACTLSANLTVNTAVFTGYTGTLSLGTFDFAVMAAGVTALALSSGVTVSDATGRWVIESTATYDFAGKVITKLHLTNSGTKVFTFYGDTTILTITSDSSGEKTLAASNGGNLSISRYYQVSGSNTVTISAPLLLKTDFTIDNTSSGFLLTTGSVTGAHDILVNGGAYAHSSSTTFPAHRNTVVAAGVQLSLSYSGATTTHSFGTGKISLYEGSYFEWYVDAGATRTFATNMALGIGNTTSTISMPAGLSANYTFSGAIEVGGTVKLHVRAQSPVNFTGAITLLNGAGTRTFIIMPTSAGCRVNLSGAIGSEIGYSAGLSCVSQTTKNTMENDNGFHVTGANTFAGGLTASGLNTNHYFFIGGDSPAGTGNLTLGSKVFGLAIDSALTWTFALTVVETGLTINYANNNVTLRRDNYVFDFSKFTITDANNSWGGVLAVDCAGASVVFSSTPSQKIPSRLAFNYSAVLDMGGTEKLMNITVVGPGANLLGITLGTGVVLTLVSGNLRLAGGVASYPTLITGSGSTIAGTPTLILDTLKSTPLPAPASVVFTCPIEFREGPSGNTIYSVPTGHVFTSPVTLKGLWGNLCRLIFNGSVDLQGGFTMEATGASANLECRFEGPGNVNIAGLLAKRTSGNKVMQIQARDGVIANISSFTYTYVAGGGSDYFFDYPVGNADVVDITYGDVTLGRSGGTTRWGIAAMPHSGAGASLAKFTGKLVIGAGVNVVSNGVPRVDFVGGVRQQFQINGGLPAAFPSILVSGAGTILDLSNDVVLTTGAFTALAGSSVDLHARVLDAFGALTLTSAALLNYVGATLRGGQIKIEGLDLQAAGAWNLVSRSGASSSSYIKGNSSQGIAWCNASAGSPVYARGGIKDRGDNHNVIFGSSHFYESSNGAIYDLRWLVSFKDDTQSISAIFFGNPYSPIHFSRAWFLTQWDLSRSSSPTLLGSPVIASALPDLIIGQTTLNVLFVQRYVDYPALGYVDVWMAYSAMAEDSQMPVNPPLRIPRATFLAALPSSLQWWNPYGGSVYYNLDWVATWNRSTPSLVRFADSPDVNVSFDLNAFETAMQASKSRS
jgi:hypothetical protein